MKRQKQTGEKSSNLSTAVDGCEFKPDSSAKKFGAGAGGDIGGSSRISAASKVNANDFVFTYYLVL